MAYESQNTSANTSPGKATFPESPALECNQAIGGWVSVSFENGGVTSPVGAYLLTFTIVNDPL